MNQQTVDYGTKFIQLIVRTIYRYRIDVGILRWFFLTANFLYFTSLLYPISRLNLQYLNDQNNSSQSNGTYSQEQNDTIIKLIGWREGYKIFFLVARPTQILNFYNDNSLNLILAILILIILIIVLGGILYAVLFTSCNNYRSFIFMKYVLLFSNVYNYYFMMIAVEILFTIGIHGGFGSQAQNSFSQNTSSEYAARVICIISIPLAYLFSLFSLIFGEQCITHEEYGLFRNNANTPLMFLITLLKFVMAFLIGIDPTYNYDLTFLLIWFAYMSFMILKFYEYYYDIPFSCFKVQNGYYMQINQTLLMVILSLFRDDSMYSFSNKYTPSLINPNMFIVLVLVLTGVFQVCSFQFWFKMRTYILFKNTASESKLIKTDHKHVMRRINMLIMNQQAAIKDQSIAYIGVFYNHQSFCLDNYCFCHQQQMLKGQQNSEILLNNRAYEQLIRMYIRNDLRLIDVFHNTADSFQFLRYMDHFLYQKKHTFALYKIIDIQIESEKMKKQINRKIMISLQVMLEILKETMSTDIKIGLVDLTVEQTSKAIEVYIQMENLKSILKVMIYKCLEFKQQTLEQMKKSFEVSQQVEDLNTKYISQLDVTEAMLMEFYNRFTTPLNQLILVFFESEIKGNLKKAHYIKQAHKQSDIAEYLNSKNMFIEVFSQEVISITATVGKKLGRIVGYSDKAPNVFGYKKQEFDYITDIKDLMPITLAKVHDEVVRFMMIRGKYNVVHIARTVFLRNKNNFIFQVNIFADINFFYAEELPFIFMAKVIRTNSGFFIVNKKGRVEGICQNFFAKINQSIESLPFMFKVDIQYIIPKFDSLINDIKPFIKLEYTDIDMTFPETKSSLFNDLFYKNKQQRQNFTSATEKDQAAGMMALDSMRTQTSQIRSKLIQRELDVMRFKIDISIQKRTLGTTKGDLVYYVVEVKQVTLASKMLNYNNSMNTSNFSMHKTNPNQKSVFSKTETFNQANTMSSLDQYEDDQNHGLKTSYIPDETIAETDGESKLSSNKKGGVSVSIQSKGASKGKKNQTKQQKKQKKQKAKANNTSQQDFNSPHLNESQMLLMAKNQNLDNSILPGVNMIETNRSAASEIMDEFRLVSLQDTQQGQFLLKTENSKLQQQNDQNKLQFENEKQLKTQENQIKIDINQINDGFYSDPNNEAGINNEHDTMVSEQQIGITEVQNKKGGNPSQKLIEMSKSTRNCDKKSQVSQISKSKKDTAYERYRSAQQKLMKNSSANDLSLSQTGNEVDEELGEKLQLGSSINGDESDKIKQIDKFSYFETFTEQRTQPQSLKFLKILKFFEYTTMIVTSIVIATSINASFSSFIQNADAILFRGNLMVPYSSFATTEFLQRQIKQFTSYPDKDTTMQYLQSELGIQYQKFYSNMTNSYQKSNLISEFSSDYVDIMNPYMLQENGVSNNPVNEKNMYTINDLYSNFTLVDSLGQLFYHMKNIISVGMNNEATVNNNQIQSILFTQHNYKNFIQRSLENIDGQFQNTINMKNSLNATITIISSLMICFALIVFIVIVANFNKFQSRMVQILNIITTVKTSSVENEIIRVRSMLESLKENDEMIEKYSFSIRQKEYELTKFSDDEEQYQQTQDSRKRKALFVKINQQKLSNLRFYIVSSYTMVLFIIYILVNLIVNIQFLETYRPALQYLDDFGRISFELPSLFSYSCIIREFQFNNQQKFSQSEISSIKQYYENSLDFITDFTLGAYKIQQKTFFTTSFVSSFNSQMLDDMCQYYPDIPLQQCQQLFNGSLSQGLVNALSTWKELFHQIQNVGFQYTNSIEFYQNQMQILNFSLVLNQAMGIFTQTIYNEVKDVIRQQQNIVLLFAIIFSITISIPKLYELTVEYNTISRRFFLAKKIVFMLPLYTLMIEETFNKMLKAIGNQLGIQK